MDQNNQPDDARASKKPKNQYRSPKRSRIFAIRINPLFVLISLVLIFLVAFSVFARTDNTTKISLDSAVKNLKDNKYSQVVIQNDGKILFLGKAYLYINNSDSVNIQNSTSYKFSSDKNTDFQVETLESFVGLISKNDVLSQLKAALGGQVSGIQQILVGENFIVGITGTAQKDILVKDVTSETFYNYLEDKKVDLATLQASVLDVKSFAGESTSSSIVERKNSGQFSNILQLGNIYLAKLKPEFVTQSYIDWTPNIYTFTDVLQKEGISLDSKEFEIVTSNIPTGISFADVLNVVTLVGFAILIFFIFRGAQSSGMGIMQFGQSKAKVFFGAKPDTTFADVAGIDEAKEELNEIVDFLKYPNKYRKLGARIPKGILMFGPPGSGKTLLARAIAGEARVPFFHTSGSEFEEMLVGAGASRVRDLFDKAKKAAPSLIFIDEIDAVARKRGTKIQTGATEQTLNQILVEMDGFEKNVNLIVIAATNRPDVLDPAILRPGRFDRQIRIDLPDVQGRKEILLVHAKNKKFEENIDFEKIAKRTVGFSGADLENILNEAAIIAAKANQNAITNADIEEAVSKVILGPAKKSRKRTDNELKLVAYHEAGHAVVSKFTPNATPVDKISIVSRGNTGGVTMFLPENDEQIMSKNKLLADITVSLGGRAAEEIALEDITTGASNDIEKATAVARRMVQKFGMSKKLGMIQYGDFEENEYIGYAYNGTKEYSEKTAEEIDIEVKQIVDTSFDKAIKILTDKRSILDKVAAALLEKEVLSKDEFEALM